MKKPEDYELKKWLCSNTVYDLKIHHIQTGVDTFDTDWEMTSTSKKKKRCRDYKVKPLVDIHPNWNSVLRAKREVVKEVKAWDEFAKKEETDLLEYERLKMKFES